ncbi:TetR/AcrR family transcriptional regulator [Alteribacillus sp. JSM 102045]|uniref:TetR/AcrR family transcriptional regulator n=1 Tax=Alteribacillus sp. JSM 102045 TaxID=1562101 RepID=UPI0035C0DE20
MENQQFIVKSKVQNEDLVKKRRSTIVDAAVDIFIKKGFDAATTKEIAEKANMKVGTMFQYVETKQDILYLVCCHIHAQMEEVLLNLETKHLSPLESIVEFYSQFVKIVDDLSDHVVLMYKETASLEPEARRSFLHREKKLRHYIESILNDGVEEGVFNLDQSEITLIAEDILVQSQMWAFRRWNLSKQFSLENYIDLRLQFLKKLL